MGKLYHIFPRYLRFCTKTTPHRILPYHNMPAPTPPPPVCLGVLLGRRSPPPSPPPLWASPPGHPPPASAPARGWRGVCASWPVPCPVVPQEALQWLDKRVDLEDDVEDEDSDAGAPRAAPGPPPPPPAGTPDTVGPVRLFAEPLTPSASSECGMTPEKLWGTPSPVEGSPYREEGALALQPPTCGHQLVQVPVQLVPLFQVYSPLVCKPQQLLLRV